MISWYIGTMGDDEFLRALESCELPPEEFGHSAHVRAAYLYLRRADWDEALEARPGFVATVRGSPRQGRSV